MGTALRAAQDYLRGRGIYAIERRNGRWHLPFGRHANGSRVLHSWQAAKHGSVVYHRTFTGAQQSRLTQSWTSTNVHLNQDLYRHLRILRARSRDLAKNNEYARKFLAMVKNNVVGPSGFSLQVKAMQSDGTLDKFDSARCEEGFAQWGRRGNCEVTGKLSWVDVQKVVAETVARDGEVLVRHARGRGKGPHNFQLQLLDPALLDETLYKDLPNGNKIRMGVEIDSWRKPVAYWLMAENAFDIFNDGYYSLKHTRVPASEVWHFFLPDFIDQLRGMPWMVAGMYRLNMLGGFDESAIVNARASAGKMGFFQSPDGDAKPLADIVTNNGTAQAPDEEFIEEADPGTFKVLPPGFEFKEYSPEYPNELYGTFVKACLRGIASGLNVSYATLANDLEATSFSSMRGGMLEEREVWKGLQTWMIESFCMHVYSNWLPEALLSGALDPLPFSKLKKFDAAVWQGRRWPWVDPLKDVQAHETAIKTGLTSRTRILLDQGLDPEEIWQELEEEEKRLKFLSKKEPVKTGSSVSTGANDEDSND